MKSLILTTQDARELDKLGGLTITKPIKPAPRYIEGASFSREADCADIWHLVGQDGNRLGAGDGVADVFASPVEVSDVVFIREPWYRLKNPQGGESERVILAADSVVQPEQAAYKWASPVSMPQDAARRFARVKSIEPAYGENVTPAWLIELVAITKEEATAEDGAPLSTSDVPEEASSYYAYVGDMSAEDRDRMVAKIDADRAPVIGVAMAVTTGACRYCGQIQEVGPHPSQAAADDTATEVCNCPTARQERRVHEQVADACERVQRLFGDDAESLDFKPIPDEAVGLLENVVEMIARGPISSASLNVRGRCKAKFSVTSKGKIKVSRSETRSCDLEDGE